MHAEVPNDLERDDARSGPIQADDHGLRRTGFPFKRRVLLLTFKTVAARFVGRRFGILLGI
jgi:hypothetical protein